MSGVSAHTRAFDAIVADLDSTAYVVTTAAGAERDGCLVGFTSLFGAETGDEVDKFKDVEWHSGPDGCPVLARSDCFAGTIIERVDTGDHVAFLLAPREGRCERSGTRPLGIQAIGDIRAGHPIPES